MIDLNRQKAAWPKDEAEADRIWRGPRSRLNSWEQTLNKHKIDPPVKVLERRYNQVLRTLREQSRMT
jgi:hypothetical protein